MILRRTVEPAVEPISLAEAKDHLRLEHALDDDYVVALVKAARQYTEQATNHAIITQTWEATFNGFPYEDNITIPFGPLIRVASITYRDVANTIQTLSPTTLYEVDLGSHSKRGRVILRDRTVWPPTYGRWNDLIVTFVAGFGDAPTDVPEPLRQAMKLLVSQMYENRTPEITGTIVTKVSFAYDSLIAPYKMPNKRFMRENMFGRWS